MYMRLASYSRRIFIAITWLAILTVGACQGYAQKVAIDPFGNPFAVSPAKFQVALAEHGVVFNVPDEWRRASERSGSLWLFITEKQLCLVEHGAGEWFDEFAQVCNVIVPFKRCVCYVGNGPWRNEAVANMYGAGGSHSGDLHVRLYLLPQSIKQFEERVTRQGLPLVEQLNVQNSGDYPTDFEQNDKQNLLIDRSTSWTRFHLSFRRLYPGALDTGCVDIRAKEYGDRTAVFMFMTTDPKRHAPVMTMMLDSFAWRKPSLTNPR
jgi:hypothetical protein